MAVCIINVFSSLMRVSVNWLKKVAARVSCVHFVCAEWNYGNGEWL